MLHCEDSKMNEKKDQEIKEVKKPLPFPVDEKRIIEGGMTKTETFERRKPTPEKE